jgi:hypothetical protein
MPFPSSPPWTVCPGREWGPRTRTRWICRPRATGTLASWSLPSHARPGAPPPSWIDSSTWIVLDLPGRAAVEAAAWLVTGAGCSLYAPSTIGPIHGGSSGRSTSWRSSSAGPPRWLPPGAASPATHRPSGSATASAWGPAGIPGRVRQSLFPGRLHPSGPGYLRRAGIGRVVYLAFGRLGHSGPGPGGILQRPPGGRLLGGLRPDLRPFL